MNGDNKGWETKKAPEEGIDVIVALENGTITIASFSAGWKDRKGNPVENVLCSLPTP